MCHMRHCSFELQLSGLMWGFFYLRLHTVCIFFLGLLCLKAQYVGKCINELDQISWKYKLSRHIARIISKGICTLIKSVYHVVTFSDLLQQKQRGKKRKRKKTFLGTETWALQCFLPIARFQNLKKRWIQSAGVVVWYVWDKMSDQS